MHKAVPKKLRYAGVTYVLADTEQTPPDLKDPNVAEVVRLVLGSAGISVDQICALGDSLRFLCEAEASEKDETDE